MQNKQQPLHYELLSQADKDTYQRLCAAMSAPTNRNKKYKRVDDFKEIIDALNLYINHDEEDKWKRCLVTGLFPFKGGIAVNIGALKKIIMKCKSSINGSFKAIGYPIVSTKSVNCTELLEGIPCLKNNLVELRQWTIRYPESSIPVQPSAFQHDLKDVSPPVIETNQNHSFMTISVEPVVNAGPIKEQTSDTDSNLFSEDDSIFFGWNENCFEF